MAVNAAQLRMDFAHMVSDLGATEAAETVEIRKPETDELVEAFGAIRASRLSREELRDTGWMEQYRFSIFIPMTTFDQSQTDEGAFAVKKGHVCVMGNGDRMRILEIEEGPAGVYRKLHLGEEWE